MRRYFNIFTMLMAVTVFAMVLRLVDISNFTNEEPKKDVKTSEVIANQTAKNDVSLAPAKDVIAQPEKTIADDSKPKTIPIEAISINKAFAEDPNAKGTNVQDMSPTKQKKYGETIYSDSELEVLKSLSDRRKELDDREAAVVKKEALLSAAEKEVDKKITDLVALKKDLQDLLDNRKSMEAERVASLVRIYEGMKPQQAAKIFDTLDMNITLAVLSGMKERKASSVLEFMSAEKAKTITTKLAEQYKLPDSKAADVVKAPNPAKP